MGLGFAAGLMGSLKVYSLWFPAERMPTLTSLQFMIGVLGSFSATKPTELMLRVLDWRELYLLFAAITVVAAGLMLLIAPRHSGESAGESFAQQLRGLGQVLSDSYFWRFAPWLCLSMGITQGLNTLYTYSWLTDVGQLSASRAATGLSLVTLVSVANFALMGPLAEAVARRGHGPLAVPIIGQVGSLLVLLLLTFQVQQGVVVQWVIFMVFANTVTLAFATLSQAFPVHMMGRAYTAFNLMGFLATAGSQWLVGSILDQFPRQASGGASPEGYSLAFAILAGVLLLAACWFAIASWQGIGAETLIQSRERKVS